MQLNVMGLHAEGRRGEKVSEKHKKARDLLEHRQDWGANGGKGESVAKTLG